MGKHWVYIIECDYDFLYVGITPTLPRNLSLHVSHLNPRSIVALYHIGNNQNVMDYCFSHKNQTVNYTIYTTIQDKHTHITQHWNSDDLPLSKDFLNFITEKCMMIKGDRWWKVFGGVALLQLHSKERLHQLNCRPTCYCNLPCEVAKTRDNELYYACPKKNIQPDYFTAFPFPTSPQCNFYQPCQMEHSISQQLTSFKDYLASPSILEIPPLKRKSDFKDDFLQSQPCIHCKRWTYTPIYARNAYRACCVMCFDHPESKHQSELSFCPSVHPIPPISQHHHFSRHTIS